MLTWFGGSSKRDCSGTSRRDFLRAGTLGALSLPMLLRTKAHAASEGVGEFVKDKSIVMVFLAGGASHIETFNPNMDGPEQSRSITGEVQTDLPGITIGGSFPLLSKQLKKAAIIRSFRHSVGNHDQAISHVLTGGSDPTGIGQDGFSMGSMVSRLRGANDPKTGLPTYAVLTAPHKDSQYSREMNRVINGSRPGTLGPSYAGFTPGNAKDLSNMTLNLPADRLDDRRMLLKQLDGLRQNIDARDAVQGFDQFDRQAMDLLTGGAVKAFDLSREKPEVLERYDTSMFKCGKKVFEPSILGRQFLLARRLVEAGCGYITVQSAGWDMHADGNNPNVADGMKMLGSPLDKALSVFLTDLEERGLLEKTLVILTGDFGRTPKINKSGGRDHWANLCTLAFFGGGIQMGQVIGKSARGNDVPASDPITTSNLMATVMHTMFDVGQVRLIRGLPANLLRMVENGKPIEGLM